MSDKSIVVDLMKIGEPTENGRIYPKDVVERALKDLRGTCFVVEGTLDRVRLADCLATVTMEVKGNMLKGKIVPLKVPAGDHLRSLLDKGEVRFSPRGHGSVKGGVVQSDYRITSVGMYLCKPLTGER